MLIPCKHTADQMPPPGEPYEPGQCRTCWLYQNRADYRQLFTLGGVEPKGGEAVPATFQPVPNKGCGCKSGKRKIRG